jgi:hypothetical protein
MEDVLEVYTRPYDPLRPQVCMDETSKQLLRETRQSLMMEPGSPQRRDYEYERGGVVNLFMFLEPLQGRRLCRCYRTAYQDRLGPSDQGVSGRALS